MSDERPHEEPEFEQQAPPTEGTRDAAATGSDDVLETALALIAEAETALADVERALERLEPGHSSNCEICGQPIEPAVLAASPGERRCGAHRG